SAAEEIRNSQRSTLAASSVEPRDSSTLTLETQRSTGTAGRVAYKTPPAASAASPPSSCSRVAPAAIASDTTIASVGTTGPSGATKDAGFTTSTNRGERSLSVAAETPV